LRYFNGSDAASCCPSRASSRRAAVALGPGRPARARRPGWTQPAEIVGNAGAALFDDLPLLFAVGVAVGFARRADGSTAVAALVGYLVFSNVLEVFGR